MQNQDQEHESFVKEQGYFLQEESNIDNQDIDLSLVSLRIALKAYFSTYQCFKGLLSNVKSTKDIRDIYTFEKQRTSYHEEYAKCIFHFHHFAELVLIKLLSINGQDIFKHSTDNKIPDEWKQTIAFNVSLKTLVDYIESKPQNYQHLEFVLNNKEMLKRLNLLRNKVWHRGLYILYYEKLDEFIGKDVLPFIVSVTEHQAYASYTKWKYKKLACEIDPITEIINQFKYQSYNMEKVAFIKELGRAAYNNPLLEIHNPLWKAESLKGHFIYQKTEHENKALFLYQNNNESKICKCPVCDANSLLIYKDADYELDENGEIENLSFYPYMIKCECCSFELHTDIENASKYEIKEIIDYWV
ncbi:hypothetical protein H6G97_51245 [Nostoc flagelliforme FACHB-838]|uniref:Uncharacterized protein n=1 Tax=Nostoc flagelliforme FACHB-838 TaxID=2692904 RepID=A0ABR8E6X5_9NOSO|nr:hypothetical protein [Nostoc flagelliforme]MBD2537123.1 hypothetical protein [Nostoc flagelliforme FACHB-838]